MNSRTTNHPNHASITLAIFISVAIAVVAGTLFALSGEFSVTEKNVTPAYCLTMPSAETVRQALADYTSTVTKLTSISTNNAIWVEPSMPPECPDKADILIFFGTTEERQKIIDILGSSFFGIPYRLMNV